MARRNHQQSLKKRRKRNDAAKTGSITRITAAATTNSTQHPNYDTSSIACPSSQTKSQSQQLVPLLEQLAVENVNEKHTVPQQATRKSSPSSCKIRPRSSAGVSSSSVNSNSCHLSTASNNRNYSMVYSPDVNCRTMLLPMAVYRPASLFAMLLVASLLPKNTFSLRWLALSATGAVSSANPSASAGGFGIVERKAFVGQAGQTSSWLTLAVDPDMCILCTEDNEDSSNNSELTAYWKDAAEALEKTIFAAQKNAKDEMTAGEISMETLILDSIPRGGDSELSPEENSRFGPPYAGLVNLGNTCYLNAQLQCAYHVPHLRKLILEAKDTVVDVEVEVEVEVEEDAIEDQETIPGGEEEPQTCQDGVTEVGNTNLEQEQPNEVADATFKETTIVSETEGTTKKKIRKTEIRQEKRPISNALRALQHTFYTLTPASKTHAPPGSTNAICRTMGINPFVQQDGQEFWKLFLPELDYSKLVDLYSGHFQDYVREIIPDIGNEHGDYGEEKKDDELTAQHDKKMEKLPRERVRTEPFLDLSIPVTEGATCSVESTLREMFTEPEILRVSEGNGWRPSKDADKVDAYKGSSLNNDGLPSLLQLHLKRFKFDWETEQTSKINDCCSFPLVSQ